MDFFFDYIMPWILLYVVISLLLTPGRIIQAIIDPPRGRR